MDRPTLNYATPSKSRRFPWMRTFAILLVIIEIAGSLFVLAALVIKLLT